MIIRAGVTKLSAGLFCVRPGAGTGSAGIGPHVLLLLFYVLLWSLFEAGQRESECSCFVPLSQGRVPGRWFPVEGEP